MSSRFHGHTAISFYLLTPVLLALAASWSHAEMGVVKSERVNIRAQAKANAEVIAQLAKGDRLTILEKKTVPYGQRSMTWLKVALPQKATVWIKSEFVKDGGVTVEKVNLRSGAGINFSIVGQAHRGDKVETVRTLAEWSEIRPLPGSFGWVSSDFVELIPELQAPPPSDKIQPAPPISNAAPRGPDTEKSALPNVASPAPARVETPATSPETSVAVGTAVTREGIIHSCAGMLIKRPGSHALWQESNPNPYIVAYLNSPNISLDPFEGRKVQVVGSETVLANWKNPVIEVQQVQPMW
jgi:SH3-like domain-containing protein